MDYLDLEWKIIYVGSAESDAHDQVLDSVLVGPVPMGRHTFVFEVCTNTVWVDRYLTFHDLKNARPVFFSDYS